MNNKVVIENFKKNNPALLVCLPQIFAALDLIKDAFNASGKLLVCGNGGSASDSMHIVGELQKSFTLERSLLKEDTEKFTNLADGAYLALHLVRGLPAVSLVSEAAMLTAMSNDVGADLCFAQQVWSLGQTNDVLFCISTSGNSRNVVLAAETAKAKGMKVVSLIGLNPNAKLIQYSDVVIMVPSQLTYRVQEYHLPVYHFMCLMLESEFFHK